MMPIFNRNHSRGSVIFSLLIGFLTPSVLLSDSGEEPYLLLYAFDTEGELLTSEMTISKTDTIIGRVVHSGELRGVDIILAESGVGMTNAAMTAQKMIDAYNPRGIIFSGIAGAIDSAVYIGDIVICSCWVTHDYGYHGAEGMIPGNIDVFSPRDEKILEKMKFLADPALIDNAHKLNGDRIEFNKIGERVPKIIIGGNCVSGNSFIDNTDKRLWLSKNFDGLTVDMESAAVAQVAFANDIPFIIFRSASDLAGGSGSSSAKSEIAEFFGVAASNSARVVMRFLEIMKK
jgi:adenosylhomocysteine nucleosidase